MAFSANTVMDTISGLLLDPDNDVWGQDTICGHVTEAQNLISGLRPDSTAVVNTAHTLTATAKQDLPSGGLKLLGLPENASGSTVRQISRELLNDLAPGWPAVTDTEIEFYMYDPEIPKVFWVYPVPSSPCVVTLMYSAAPADFTTASTDIAISPTYITALYEWVLYRCLSMEGPGMDLSKANVHLSNFYTVLGMKQQNEIALQQIQEATS